MESVTPTPHDPSHADPARPDPEFAESLGRGHEQRDTMIKPILVFVIVLTISIALVQLAVWGLQRLMEAQDAMQDPQKVSSVNQSSVSDGLKNHVAPPEPRLQPSPFHPSMDHEDWDNLAKRWDTELATVGKFDEPDRVHIPVSRVIQMASEHGLGSLKMPTTAPGK